MIVFNCRSPFIIPVAGDVTQIATKIEMYIWRVGDSQPALPSKVIEKTKFSDNQITNHYNISPFVSDYVDTFDATKFGYNVKVIPYYKLTTSWIALTTLNYVSVYGYENYSSSNLNYEPTFIILRDTLSVDYFTAKPNIDIIFDFTTNSDSYLLSYVSASGTNTTTITDTNDIKLFRVPMCVLDEVTTFKIIRVRGGVLKDLYETQVNPVCEIKYTPYNLKFVNRFGGLQQLTLFKNSTQTIEVKGSEYNTNTFTTYPTYDTSVGQKRIYNKNGSKTIKCNTGWLNESQNVNVQDLMLSELLTLSNPDNSLNAAVVLKSSSMLLKTSLNERMINYEFDFEIANALINNVV